MIPFSYIAMKGAMAKSNFATAPNLFGRAFFLDCPNYGVQFTRSLVFPRKRIHAPSKFSFSRDKKSQDRFPSLRAVSNVEITPKPTSSNNVTKTDIYMLGNFGANNENN